jgi:hypothetical protein
VSGDVKTRIDHLEELLAQERARSTFLLQRLQRAPSVPSPAAPAPGEAEIERKVAEFRTLLGQEQRQAAGLLQRILETGEAVSAMQTRLEEIEARLADVVGPNVPGQSQGRAASDA